MTAFTKEQPKSGETILHCGHRKRQPMHWFQCVEPLKFQRPNGTLGEASWFCACDVCFRKHGADVIRFGRGDEVWQGDEPIIVAAEKN